MVAKQAQLRESLLKALDDNGVVALVYPTIRRTAAKIGEPQGGGNCHASAATGLPAITVPAGFAEDGMPVGVEFLGRPFSEPDLLKLAYSFEQATHHRRLPSLTPPLR
jgi:Asp-tRNA(Asn)/Glu-tRNA(Gln) amidotransferase A subunit family amidase